MGLPVFAASVTPDSCVKTGPGTVGLPVTIGTRSITSGDIIVADVDGVTNVPLAQVEQIIARLEAVKRAEAELLAKVRGGLASAGGIAELLRSDRVKWLD